MHDKRLLTITYLLLAMFLLPAGARAQGYQNGNRLALDYTRSDEAGRTRLRESRAGAVHTFRYLEVMEIEMDDPERPRRINIVTVEPSSDMEVQMIVTQRNSLQLAETLNIGDHVAADGRIVDLSVRTENRMVLQPVRLNFKDRATPKHGPELLREVDPNAW